MLRNNNHWSYRTATLLAATAALWGLNACNPADGTAMICPPGMMPATGQPICIQGPCGNGRLDTNEACDDGNQIDGDGCSADCRSTEICGNAVVDHSVGEVCDDGNVAPGDRCCGDCRSCPELAVRPLGEDADRDIEQAIADALPCHSGSASMISSAGAMLASLMFRALAARPLVPAPLLAMVPASFLSGSPLGGSIIKDIPPEGRSVPATLGQSRSGAKETERRLQSEKRKHKHLQEAQDRLAEELQRAQQTVTQLEQFNAELHQRLAEECQEMQNGRSKVLQ